MNEVVKRICKQLQQEAQTIIDYQENGSAVIASGAENSVETVALFNDLTIDAIEHCQKLVLSLSQCFFQKKEDSQK